MRTTFEQQLTHILDKHEFFDVQTHKSNPRKFRCEVILITETGVTLRGSLYTQPGRPYYSRLHHTNSTSLRLNYAEFAPLSVREQDGSHRKTHEELEKLGIPEVFRYLIADQIRMLQSTHTKMVKLT